ncbi:cupin domain-containing protein [Arthrobacter sp. UYEF3]|uniref:helix-turn-helix domain-containing protein n=1 Tax=Arthrobacter sp. UYEF3 TaxID=1756365 RepID=UPI0033949795
MSQLPGDDAETDTLGARIRRIRFAQNLSIRQLAKDIGCSPSHISQIERSLSEPSISMLTAIASRLGRPVDSILTEQAEESERRTEGEAATAMSLAIVQRAARRQKIHIQGGVTSELLLPAVERKADFCEYIYEPAQVATQRQELLQHPGREYGVVLEGRLHMTLKFEDFELEAGDSIAFDSSIPHAFWNPGNVPARVIWFSSPVL